MADRVKRIRGQYDLSLYKSAIYKSWQNMKTRCTYKNGLTIDRINNDGNYSKENCKWATRIEQANNRKTNTFITINNITKTFAQWCALSDAKPSTIRQRYYTYGWNIERALSL